MKYDKQNISERIDYSTRSISNELVREVVDAIQNIRGWGSVEIQVQDFTVVQITERNIKKTTAPSIRQLNSKSFEKKKENLQQKTANHI